MMFSDVMEFGPITQEEITRCIKNEAWQTFRKSLKGLSTQEKMKRLRSWKASHSGRCATVVVTNYINALKRGGQIK
jgi:hypothetical protein